MGYFSSLSIEEIASMHKQEKNPTIKTRLAAVLHMKEGKSTRAVSDMKLMSKSSASIWKRRFDEEGYNGLSNRKAPGNKCMLNEKERKEVLEYAYGKPTRDVHNFMVSEYGIEYHPRSVPRLLRRLGLARITPRKCHRKADAKKQAAFREHIKKVA